MAEKKKIIVLAALLALGLAPAVFAAPNQLTFTVTPPFFRLALEPGETWSGKILIANDNDYDLSLYASVMDFQASGESGIVRHIPLLEGQPENPERRLSRWIGVVEDPIFIRKGRDFELPFTVAVPPDAEPGGHYAAILIGTQPSGPVDSGAAVKVSSAISALVLLNVAGDIVESGVVREFSSDQKVYSEPDVNFTLRFQNTGNVHILPQGLIEIYDTWGKKKSEIVINGEGGFGNVLPGTTRKFRFAWQGSGGIWESGRYKADLTLSFGQNRETASRQIYFWILPIKPILGALGIIAGIGGAVILGVKIYIKRKLRDLGQRPAYPPAASGPRIWPALVIGVLLIVTLGYFLPTAPRAPKPVLPAILEDLRDIKITINNGSGLGSAAGLALFFDRLGSDIRVFGNPKISYESTVIRYAAGMESKAIKIAELIGGEPVLESADFLADEISVTLGKDYNIGVSGSVPVNPVNSLMRELDRRKALLESQGRILRIGVSLLLPFLLLNLYFVIKKFK